MQQLQPHTLPGLRLFTWLDRDLGILRSISIQMGLPAATRDPLRLGAVIKDERGHKIARVSRYLGTATNNQAEYRALISALEMASNFHPAALEIHVDSELVVKQLDGEYRVKNPDLRPLLGKVRKLLSQFETVNVTHIPGELNSEAHALAASALRGKAD